jgi:hypothetical protein
MISFNITSTCNLNCDGCYIGSNFDYKEHQSWQEQKTIYEKWSEKVELRSFEIYGGEPFLNPQWYDWFTGISKLWPNAKGCITSNGYALTAKKNQKLYDFLKQSNGQYWLDVSHHNDNKLDWLVNQIYKFLGDNVIKTTISLKDAWLHRGIEYDVPLNQPMFIKDLKKSYNAIKDPAWPDINSVEDWNNLPEWIRQECETVHNVSLENLIERNTFDDTLDQYVDSNGVTVMVRDGTNFSTGSLLVHDRGVNFYNSDMQHAYDSCYNKSCVEMYNGLVHQCSSVGHFNGWSEQLPMELTDQQRQLIDSYTTITAESSLEEIAQWFDHDRHQPMPQCSLCPENRKAFKIYATTEKIKF